MSSSSPHTAPGRRGVMAWLATCGRVTGTWEPRRLMQRTLSFKSKNSPIIMILGRLKHFKHRRNRTSS